MSEPAAVATAETVAAATARGGVADFSHKMYIVVNSDLKMRPGKICAQVGHAVAAWTRRLESAPTDNYKQWLSHSEPMIVLKADQKTMDKICSTYNDDEIEIVKDAGRTQVDRGALTVVAFAPRPTAHQPPETKLLKLLN